MEGKHTPGPWYNSGNDFVRNGESLNDASIAAVYPAEGGPECKANTNLITAAPELLEFAEKELQWLLHIQAVLNGTSIGLGVGQAIKSAQAAISKARGQS